MKTKAEIAEINSVTFWTKKKKNGTLKNNDGNDPFICQWYYTIAVLMELFYDTFIRKSVLFLNSIFSFIKTSRFVEKREILFMCELYAIKIKIDFGTICKSKKFWFVLKKNIWHVWADNVEWKNEFSKSLQSINKYFVSYVNKTKIFRI